MSKAFERYMREKNLSDNTIAAYSTALRQFNAQFGQLSREHLQSYKMWLIERYKPQTINQRLRAMNCYLEYVGKEEWKLSFVKVQQKPYLENVISNADYEYLKNYLRKDGAWSWYFVVRYLANTGARVSELTQIKVEHVKLGYIELYSKGGKIRRIYIPKALREETLVWLEETGQQSGFLFLNKYGNRISARGIAGQLKQFAIRYGLNPDVVYPHSFRHRFAKNFLERCNDISFLADLMGHESIETTRIYVRKTATEQRALVDELIDW